MLFAATDRYSISVKINFEANSGPNGGAIQVKRGSTSIINISGCAFEMKLYTFWVKGLQWQTSFLNAKKFAIKPVMYCTSFLVNPALAEAPELQQLVPQRSS